MFVQKAFLVGLFCVELIRRGLSMTEILRFKMGWALRQYNKNSLKQVKTANTPNSLWAYIREGL